MSEIQIDNKKENTEKNSSDNEFLCDNPISLDEIERGLWLGKFCFLCLFALVIYFPFCVCIDE